MSFAKSFRKLLAARTTDEILEVGRASGLVENDKVVLSGQRLTLKYEGVDLSVFQLEGADLSGSQFRNCNAIGAIFDGCRLDKVKFVADGGKKMSMNGASFKRASMRGAYFGPGTLDLGGTRFVEAEIADTKFMMGQLSGADFSNGRLQDVHLHHARLNDARFCNAILERVNLGKAILEGADFTGATFRGMEEWGEPDFSGALIEDNLRFQYGIVKRPVERIDEAMKCADFSEDERAQLVLFRERVASFAANASEAMLIASEYDDILAFSLFVRVIKRLKGDNS